MISVIIPSRNRPNELLISLTSLGLAKHGLEALVWLDDDDPQLDKYKESCVSKSGLSKHEFEIRQTEVERNIEFSEESEYDEFLDKAIKNLPDPKDAPYLALALSLNASIWSNDSHLKEQSLVKVLSTSELVKLLGL